MEKPKRCPVCQSTRLTENEQGEINCKRCNWLWKPTGLTTSKDIPTGTKIELTEEEKAKQKENDLKVLESYNFQIDNHNTEIKHIQNILDLDLANREYKDRLRLLKEQLERFNNLKHIIEERNK